MFYVSYYLIDSEIYFVGAYQFDRKSYLFKWLMHSLFINWITDVRVSDAELQHSDIIQFDTFIIRHHPAHILIVKTSQAVHRRGTVAQAASLQQSAIYQGIHPKNKQTKNHDSVLEKIPKFLIFLPSFPKHWGYKQRMPQLASDLISKLSNHYGTMSRNIIFIYSNRNSTESSISISTS